MKTTVILLTALSLLTVSQVEGDDLSGDLATAFSGLVGDWEGELTYLDYQSSERVALPARLEASLAAGGMYLVTDLTFSDPDHEVRSLDVSSFDASTRTLITHAFAGGEAEREELQLSGGEISSPTSWTLTFLGSGSDDGRSADIRITRSLDGDRIVLTKEVRYVEAPSGDWITRNELSLTRVRPIVDPSALVGTWRIDLRPTPDAEPYYAELVVTAANDRTLEGRFYETAIREARVNVDWGCVQIAFVTEDGTGAYNTSARLLADGTLEGTTHSLGRDFLSRWQGSNDSR